MNIKQFISLCLILALASAFCAQEEGKISEKCGNNRFFKNETFQSGYFPLKDKGEIYYYLFESRQSKDKDPLIIWLTGGPGCSSEVHSYMEMGPLKLGDDLEVDINPFSWNNEANLVFFDQPQGSGYSPYKEYELDTIAVAKNFYKVFVDFLEKFPEYKGRKMFFAGTSYAGHWVPAFTAEFLKNENQEINLQGSVVGNGLFNHEIQLEDLIPFSLEKDIINKEQYDEQLEQFKVCKDKIRNSDSGDEKWNECWMKGFFKMTGMPYKFNVYDYTAPCNYQFCYDFTTPNKYFNDPEVKQALGAKEDQQWQPCNQELFMTMKNDFELDLSKDVEYLLSKDYPLMIYAGDLDYMCHYRGIEKWSYSLDWKHKKEFKDMKFTKNAFGEFKSINKFTLYRIYDAGHFAGMYKPDALLAMINDFMKNGDIVEVKE